MKIARVKHEDRVFYGEVKDSAVYAISGDLYGEFIVSGESVSMEAVKLLAPVEPSKIICVGKNYTEHILEMREQGFIEKTAELGLPERPELFFKPPSSLNSPQGDVVYPTGSLRVDYEGEIAVIIGKKGRYIKEENAHNHIFGLALLNDVSRRDRPKQETQWTSGKSYDTFCPIGPYITTLDSVNLSGIPLQTYHNGELKQDSTIDYMIFKIPYLIEFISDRMTLMPGDVIATGTPDGVGTVKVGDVVRVYSSALGEIVNKFVEEIKR